MLPLTSSVFLMPGYGAQGVRGEAVAPALTPEGTGALVSSSREIIFAYQRREDLGPEAFAEAAAQAACRMRDDINQYITWPS